MMATIPTARRSPGRALGHDVSEARDLASAMERAGIDYHVTATPLNTFTVLTEDGTLNSTLAGYRLVHRSDTGAGLGVVRSRYTVVQNRDAFAVADNFYAAGARFDSAGESEPGRPFVSMLLPDATANVTPLDAVIFQLLLTADHTGARKVTASIKAERLVCTNGMTVSLPGMSTEVAISHTSSADLRLAQATEILNEAHRYAKFFQSVAASLIEQQMTVSEFTAWIDGLYPRPADPASPAKLTRWERRRAELLGLFRSAETQAEGRATRWAGLNAVTEYLSWQQPMRGNAESRAARQLEDVNRAMRDRALATLTG